MMVPKFEITVRGLRLDTIGLDEVIIRHPDGWLTLLQGFPVYAGRGIIESLLDAYPCCELYADERAMQLHAPIRIH